MQRILFTLKFRLLFSVLLVLLIGFLLGSLFILHNAREAVEDELSSSLKLADQIVKGLSLNQTPNPDQLAPSQNSLDQLRHIQLLVEHQYEEKLINEDSSVKGVPDWFVNLVKPDSAIPSSLRVHRQGTDDLVIAADPADEIQEVWRDVEDLILLFACLITCICFFVYIVISRSLHPLNALREGFVALENNRLDVRISERAVPELAAIHRRFNHMVGILSDTTQAKQDLTRKLISLQEDERNQIARELHDEMGPYLFSIRVDINSARSALPENPETASNKLSNIDATTVQLQSRIRELLKLLRPLSLNDLTLKESLDDLIRLFSDSSPHILWQMEFALPDDLADVLNVTIYRIIQECLTNIARHSSAKQVLIKCSSISDQEVILRVSDDGIWKAEGHENGMGLSGMRERVEGLNGKFELIQNQPSGLIVLAKIPVGNN